MVNGKIMFNVDMASIISFLEKDMKDFGQMANEMARAQITFHQALSTKVNGKTTNSMGMEFTGSLKVRSMKVCGQMERGMDKARTISQQERCIMDNG
jgi:hypothetical protein